MSNDSMNLANIKQKKNKFNDDIIENTLELKSISEGNDNSLLELLGLPELHKKEKETDEH